MNAVKIKIAGVIVSGIAAILAGMTGSCGTSSAETVKLGVVYPLSGPLETAGKSAKNGVDFALEIINNEYDLDLPLARSKGIGSLNGVKLKAIFSDSGGTPETGRAAAEKLITQENVTALVGCYQSAVTEEVATVTEKHGIPFLTATSTAPSLTRKGLEWFFRTTPDEEVFIRDFYEFLKDVQGRQGNGLERLGIVYEDSVWGSEVSLYAEQYAGAEGYQPVRKVHYSSGTTNVDEEVRLLKDGGIDVLIQASYTADAILFVQTYKRLDFNPGMIFADDAGFNDPEFLRAVGNDGDYIFVRQVWSKDVAETKPLAGTVNDLFRRQCGIDMDDTSARVFSGVLVLADAIDRAGSTEPEKIREALLETDLPPDRLIMPWDGVTFGPVTHQNVLARGILSQIVDRTYYTVWPRSLATRDITWPVPVWDERG